MSRLRGPNAAPRRDACFERSLTLQANDRYQGRPAVETVLVHQQLLRSVEQRREVVEGELRILHMRYRLERWQTLDLAWQPPELFKAL